MAKNVNTRMRQKCDTSENWGKASNFRPLEGEIVVINDAFVVNGKTAPGIKIGRKCDDTLFPATTNTSQGENFLLSELPYLDISGKTIISVAEGANGYALTLSDASTMTISDGATPVRGIDYWTEADKAEIQSYVDDAILNGEW